MAMPPSGRIMRLEAIAEEQWRSAIDDNCLMSEIQRVTPRPKIIAKHSCQNNLHRIAETALHRVPKIEDADCAEWQGGRRAGFLTDPLENKLIWSRRSTEAPRRGSPAHSAAYLWNTAPRVIPFSRARG